jgi:hypothetical protein
MKKTNTITTIQCLDISEMIAEKTRAALTREVPAIRDFYDLWYMTYKESYILEDYRELIKNKCEDTDWRWTIESFVPDRNTPAVVLPSLPFLHQQIESGLRSVLLDSDEFNLEHIYTNLLAIKNILQSQRV